MNDDLFHQVEAIADAQNRSAADVVSEAVRKYLDELSWMQFVARNEAIARANGITEQDVDRLISEARREAG